MRALGAVLFLALVLFPENSQANPQNVIVIVTDDQRFDTMQYMPLTDTLLFKNGVEFKNSYVTTAACCPSRSSILTGMYASKHGVRRNRMPLRLKTVVEALHSVGYYTGLVGKYLNSWEGKPRPEFDYWVAFRRGSVSYYDPELNVSGRWVNHNGYITYILRDYVKEFLLKAPPDKPFFLLWALNAPHYAAEPAPEDRDLFLDLAPHRPPSFNRGRASGKPEWLRRRRPLSTKKIASRDLFRKKQLQSLQSVDRSIKQVLDTLKEKDILEKTVIWFISDNGIMWGEHGLGSKNCGYEESVRVPFAVRYPGAPPRVVTELAANIDIAPSVYQIAGLKAPDAIDGISLLPAIISGKKIDRKALLIEGWPIKDRRAFKGIRSSDYIYLESDGEELAELYDLSSDPYQLKNLSTDPGSAGLLSKLKQQMESLRKEHGLKWVLE